jgi:hypothetical protein
VVQGQVMAHQLEASGTREPVRVKPSKTLNALVIMPAPSAFLGPPLPARPKFQRSASLFMRAFAPVLPIRLLVRAGIL